MSDGNFAHIYADTSRFENNRKKTQIKVDLET